MNGNNGINRKYDILSNLSKLPRNMIKLHGLDNVTEFVLHELCHENCFDINKAAYVIDNPDFDCVKGVAGHSKAERYNGNSIWLEPEKFSSHMKEASFNNRVRSVHQPSSKRAKTTESDLAQAIAQDLAIENFGYCVLDAKHDNHSLLIFEKPKEEVDQESLLHGLSLLCFCPVF